MIARRATWISVCFLALARATGAQERRRSYTIGIIGLAVMRFKKTAE